MRKTEQNIADIYPMIARMCDDIFVAHTDEDFKQMWELGGDDAVIDYFYDEVYPRIKKAFPTVLDTDVRDAIEMWWLSNVWED